MKNQSTFKINIKGRVQGVGFRPFIYRIAHELNLKGSVENNAKGVEIFINANDEQINLFIHKIWYEKPESSIIFSIDQNHIKSRSFDDFKIIKSNTRTANEITEISPDISVCSQCMIDIQNQQHRINYPLINCTQCGPRFSIIKDLPYDRHQTTMKPFKMCRVCDAEYSDILDRRFHAQPIACNNCGPEYKLFSEEEVVNQIDSITDKIAEIIDNGGVISLKGIGGYTIICDAENQMAVKRIRTIKKRYHKPFAVMVKNIETAREYAVLSTSEEKEMSSWRRPIILLQQKKSFSNEITSGFSSIGLLLPYMPLHYMIFEKTKTKLLVFTSANFNDEPIVIDDREIKSKLLTAVDAIVIYNRAIFNRVDDSVIQIIDEELQIIRRSRGYAPASISTINNVDHLVATGAELTNCFAVGRGKKAFLSQHIGDLKNTETYLFFQESMMRFQRLFQLQPRKIISDLHPDYLSTQYARENGIEWIQVQHHHAHIASCMCENKIDEKVIGIAFDGTGFGLDGNSWGGEFFISDLLNFERFTHLDYIALAGGDKAIKEPWRIALSILYKLYGHELWNLDIPFVKNLSKEKAVFLIQMIDQNINCPLSSGMGRWFDAVAALCGLIWDSGFSAEAPMRLEDVLVTDIKEYYPFELDHTIKLEPIFKNILTDLSNEVEVGIISAKFHQTIVQFSNEVCLQIRNETQLNKVVLSGGSFQNKYLSSMLKKMLIQNGFEVFTHHEIPPNDAGIALGQLAIAAAQENN